MKTIFTKMFSFRSILQVHQRRNIPSLVTYITRNSSTQPRVHVKQGELEGTLEDLPSGKTYASFKGIPFAKPPVGNLRFRPPLPPEKWIGVREAKEHGEVCTQFDLATASYLEGSEDCLFLNVYTPHKKGPPLPVMVYIHGGAFYSGSGDSLMYGPEYLVENDIILVTLNYRLESLGFLCLDTNEVPGNAGIKDQVFALRWIKENISQFGGDPNNVTVVGESVGGCAATLHMVSPMSKGLGNKFIGQSGTFFNEWAYAPNPRDRAFRLGKYLGIETKNPDELVQYLRKLPAVELTKVTKETQTEDETVRGLPIRFSPTVEKTFQGQECFLPRPPSRLLIESIPNCPILLGYNNGEGLFAIKDNLKKSDKINDDFQRKVPRRIFNKVSKEELVNITRNIKEFYFGDEGITKENITGIVNLESDYNFSMDILRFARHMANISTAPVFFYRFQVDGEFNVMKMSLGLNKYEGACHADDIFYLFKSGFETESGSKTDLAVKRMAKMWSNFAKYGNPTPAVDELVPVIWKPMTQMETNFLEIDFDLQMGKDPDNERYEFWKNLHRNVQVKSKP